MDLLAVGRGVRAGPQRFFSWFNDFQLSAPLVEASSGHPQLLRQFTDIIAALHALYSHPLKFPGVSLPLHPVSSPGNCAQFCVSLQGFTPSLVAPVTKDAF